jgi:hypothetical protein
MMKHLILNNWVAKVASLVLASTLWFLIKKNIEAGSPDRSLIEAPLVLTPTDGNHHNQ